MQDVLVISTSHSTSSKSRLCAPVIVNSVHRSGWSAATFDVRDLPPIWITSEKLTTAPQVYRDLNAEITAAKGVVFLTPVYCYGGSSALKCLVELNCDALHRKPIAFVSAAGTLRSHLAVGSSMLELIYETEAFCFPKTVQVTGDDFDSNGRPRQGIVDRIEELAEEFVLFCRALQSLNNFAYEKDGCYLSQGQERMKLNHINILVTDLERSLRFYCDILGARYLRNLGPKKAVTDLYGNEFFLEEAEKVQVNPSWHIGFRTDRDGVYRFAKKLERFSVPLVKGNNPVDAVSDAEDGFRTALYFQDPDGLLIEVYSPERQTLVDEGGFVSVATEGAPLVHQRDGAAV